MSNVNFLAIAFIAIAGLAVLAVVQASEAQPSRTSDGGNEYNLACNENGYVLASQHPIARLVGSGADAHFITRTEELYFGRSCDAYNELLGTGVWCWANGGFVIEFQGLRLGFPRQELFCPANDSLGLECRC